MIIIVFCASDPRIVMARGHDFQKTESWTTDSLADLNFTVVPGTEQSNFELGFGT